jgi:hypothetical protein
MRNENIKGKKTTIARNLPKRQAPDEKARLFEGLTRVGNAGDSVEDYLQLQKTASSFWPITIHGPYGDKGLDQQIAWVPSGHALFLAFKHYLRKVWIHDFTTSDGTIMDGVYLGLLLGLDIRFTEEKGYTDGPLFPDESFHKGWLQLKESYPDAYCQGWALAVPNWGHGGFDYVPVNDFQRSVYALLKESWRAKRCRFCASFFIADKSAQSFCSSRCSNARKNERSLDYWRKHGSQRRSARMKKTK